MLSNGVRVVLVADAEADKSAAVVSVGVGSMQDPRAYQGLAHFLEHMLFMGTRKYPNESEYSTFISSHGGSRNAFTSPDVTTYFFDIPNEYLSPAMDRLAQVCTVRSFRALPVLHRTAVQSIVG